MFRTPILNQNDLFLDIDGKPIVRGKIDILDPVSNNPITVWTYSDDEYTVAANPVILDIEGRTEQTIFSDRISYCRLYSYHGLDENNHPIYVFVRDWFCGQNDTTESKEYITGMADLKDVDPSVNSSINVLGYHNAYDCGLRTYVWDSGCQQDEDGGYIVASDVDENGRWVLSFDGEYLPSTYYGVYAGQEANINALLSYVGTVGSNSVKTAPGVYFKPGDYQTANNLATTKKVLLDADTTFASTYFDCKEMRVLGTPTNAIGDIFTTEGEVHSSWFRTLKYFFGNTAPVKVLDGFNGTDSNIDNVYTVSGTLKGSGHINMTFGTGAKLIFSCIIDAKQFVSPSDKVRFQGQRWSDDWWTSTNPAQFDFVNNTEYRNTYSDDMNLSRFGNALLWAKAKAANGDTTVDFEGRTISSFDFNFSNVSNVTITGTCTFTYPYNITLNNVKATTTFSNSGYVVILNNCDITLNNMVSCAAISATNSRIYSAYTVVNSNVTAIDMRGGSFEARVKINDHTGNWNVHNYDRTQKLKLDGVKITQQIDCCGNCEFYGCTISNKVNVFPYISSGEGAIEYTFERCNFTDAFVVKTDLRNWAYDSSNFPESTINVKLNANTWNQTNRGLELPYYREVNTSRRLLKDTSANKFIYKNNVGNCLDEMVGSGIPKNDFDTGITISSLSNVYRMHTPTTAAFVSDHNSWWTLLGSNIAQTTSKYSIAMYDNSDGSINMNKQLIFINRAYYDPSVNDMFQWYLAISDGNPGDVHNNIVIFRMA